MIVAAALPLVAEYGAAVTTGRIARAAGIGEGTVFRAFAGKDELLEACVAEVLSPDHVLRELASIPVDQPLAARLTEAAGTLGAHLERLRTVLGALHTSGFRRGRGLGPDSGERPATPRPAPSRDASTQAVCDVVAELLEPDRAALRLAPERLAAAFVSVLSVRPPRPAAEPGPDPTLEELVDLLLHGALRTRAPGSASAPDSAPAGAR